MTATLLPTPEHIASRLSALLSPSPDATIIAAWPDAVALAVASWLDRAEARASAGGSLPKRPMAIGALAYPRRLPSPDALDAWYTPLGVARACVDAIEWTGRTPRLIVEPSAGGGAFVLAALARWPEARVLAVDQDAAAPVHKLELLEPRLSTLHADWPCVVADGRANGAEIILGNPPYSEAQYHIEAALDARPAIVAMLLRLAFLEGQGRAAFWKTHPPIRVDVLTRRPSFGAGGRTDACAYAWFQWRTGGFIRETRLGWLPW